MKIVQMETLSTNLRVKSKKFPSKIVVPGGWGARVPVITAVDSQTMLLYGRFFQSQGKTPLQAEEAVIEAVNSVFEANWVRFLGISIRYWARKYAERYPSKIQPDRTLKGFDPAKLQNVYVPGSRPGRSGFGYVNKLFEEMAS